MKEMKISFEVSIVLERTDVHWVEEELLRVREEVFLEVFKRVMREIEEGALRRERVCKKCGLLLVRNGRELKRIKTLIGTVEVNRVRLRCQGCQEDIYPLDEAIGLGSGEQMSLGVRGRALWAAAEVSYEKAHQFLEKFTGLEVSRHKIHGMAREEGRRIEVWEEEGRHRVFEQGKDLDGIGKKAPEVLYIQVDGTGVNDRASREWMECKVGATLSERVLVSKDRVWLRDKRSYA